MNIKSCNFDECYHKNQCCTPGDKNCNKLICLDGPAEGGCFTLEQIDQGVKADPTWGKNVCNSFCDPANCGETVDYPVDPCPRDICESKPCGAGLPFVCYNTNFDKTSWQCSENKAQKEIHCSSRYGSKLCDLSKCGDYPGQDDCYGRGRCVRFNEEGCTGCSCEYGYVGYFCDECAGGYSCIENGDIVDSEKCLPPNECKYTGGRCNNRGTPVGRNGPCSCPPGGKRYSGFDCQICNSGICYNPITKQVKDDAKYNGMNCPYPYVCK